MVNFYESVLSKPEYHRQFSCGESLITLFHCPVHARFSSERFTDLWTNYNLIMYVTEGRKMWYTANGSYDLQKGSCVFVRKGASIMEQFDVGFCVVLFFIPDDFLCETLKTKSKPLNRVEKKYDPVILLNTSNTLVSFFLSMSSFFGGAQEPDKSLLELKFRELILTLADDSSNAELLCYFCSLLHEPQSVSLQRIMDDNYCFNLKLEEYAELSNRSLSAFKRDFQKLFHTSPGKWLLHKRLDHALHLLTNMHKTVSEAAFESGFENSSHFSRCFKERFGTSPLAARQTPAN